MTARLIKFMPPQELPADEPLTFVTPGTVNPADMPHNTESSVLAGILQEKRLRRLRFGDAKRLPAAFNSPVGGLRQAPLSARSVRFLQD